MGDRGNICIRSHKGDVWLYTHYHGSTMLDVVNEALKKGKDRWNDPPYLARIIFNTMTRGYEQETTGFGISPREGDSNHPHVIVDCEKQTVEQDSRKWTFENFIKAMDLLIKEWKEKT